MDCHYIQKAFIENFVQGEKIYAFDNKNKVALPPLHNARSIAFEKDLYQFKLELLNSHFNKDLSSAYPNWNENAVENLLNDFEIEGLRVIKTIIKNESIALDKLDKIYLYAYLIILGKRTPTIKCDLAQMFNVQSCETLQGIFLSNLLNNNLLQSDINKLLDEYELFLLRNNEGVFVLSDNPCKSLFCGFPEMFIPLTSTLGLLIKHREIKSQYCSSLVFDSNIVNDIDCNETLRLMIKHQLVYIDRWIFAAYTEKIVRLVPDYIKLLDKFL